MNTSHVYTFCGTPGILLQIKNDLKVTMKDSITTTDGI